MRLSGQVSVGVTTRGPVSVTRNVSQLRAAPTPATHVTGRSPVELPLTPATEELFQAGWAVTWAANAGAAASTDTFLVTEEGPRVVTPTEVWPLKRIRIQGAEFVRPDVLQR